MYDLIVIGAGPAGSAAAKTAADGGRRVLLVEMKKMPRNKSCSGLLIQKSLRLVSEVFGAEPPCEVQCAPTDNHGMIFINEDGREFRFEQLGLNIWRHSFDHWLAQLAAGAGAEVQDSTAALACNEQNGTVTVEMSFAGKKYTEQAAAVIVCEGAGSGIKRKLLGSTKDYIHTYQTFNRGRVNLDPHFFYAFLQREFSEHDAWANVKDENLIFGVAATSPNRLAPYYHTFTDFLTRQYGLQIEETHRDEHWIMPHIRPGCPVDYGCGRVLFAGEAAGFLNPMGEGISSGIESGRAAASVVLDLLGKQIAPQELLAAYERRVAPTRDYMVRQWRFTSQISYSFMDMI
ncbi:FAD-dependent monooxygenase [Ruminococcaceae bacterium OttesenSCG-928-D13]|nr:FAD-dependent monooxygenase [Ruminococcaceae bacterium OttesenSCG-928-D13]